MELAIEPFPFVGSDVDDTRGQVPSLGIGSVVFCLAEGRLGLCMYTYEDIRALVEEIRLVNRAKLILIKMRGMSEGEAHRFIVRSAMDRCVKKRAVAREIIEYHEKYEERKQNAEGNSGRP